MKVGDLVRYTPDGVVVPTWEKWYGIIIKEVPGTHEIKVVCWNRDNNVITSTQKGDLELVSEHFKV